MRSPDGVRRDLRFGNWPGHLVLGMALIRLVATPLTAASLADDARMFRQQLTEKVLPYWYDTTQDNQHGGYLLADDQKGRRPATEKQLVSQARMVWGFAHAHRKGLSSPERDYLTAARKGYLFLLAYFRDSRHGGYYWKTDLEGKPTHDCKFLYGQAFVIYAFVELHRAGGGPKPLRDALELYQVLQKNLHDTRNGGWIEHTERDWRPLKAGDPRNQVEVVGYRSANAHLHWMEALTELYEVTRDAAVGKSLAEALRLNQQYFYPPDAGRSCFYRHPDWSPVTDPASAGLSYGHNVEFAWLMIRAEQVLGRPPSWAHFRAHIDHALRYGYDHERGGLYARGIDDQPATDTDKVWWAAAELMAALSDAVLYQPNPAYTAALDRQIRFLLQHQIDPKDGIWLDTVRADGQPKSTGKAHSWKAAYHDVRALVKFMEAFSTNVH